MVPLYFYLVGCKRDSWSVVPVLFNMYELGACGKVFAYIT